MCAEHSLIPLFGVSWSLDLGATEMGPWQNVMERRVPSTSERLDAHTTAWVTLGDAAAQAGWAGGQQALKLCQPTHSMCAERAQRNDELGGRSACIFVRVSTPWGLRRLFGGARPGEARSARRRAGGARAPQKAEGAPALLKGKKKAHQKKILKSRRE